MFFPSAAPGTSRPPAAHEMDWGEMSVRRQSRLRLLRNATVVVVAVGATLASPGIAVASDGPNVSPDDVRLDSDVPLDHIRFDIDVPQPGDKPFPLTDEARAKSVEALKLYLRSTGSTAAERKVAQAELQRLDTGAVTTTPGMASTSTAAAPDYQVLGVVQVGQQKSYWCGPASAYMMLRHDYRLTSAYDGQSLSQTALAGSNYLQTEQRLATTFASGAMASGINRWRGSSFYVQVGHPSGVSVKSELFLDIGMYSMTLAADTVAIYNGPHYNNHPNNKDPIGHWIVGYGYSGSGTTSMWMDPSTSVWPNVSPAFQADTTSFTNTYLQSNGTVW